MVLGRSVDVELRISPADVSERDLPGNAEPSMAEGRETPSQSGGDPARDRLDDARMEQGLAFCGTVLGCGRRLARQRNPTGGVSPSGRLSPARLGARVTWCSSTCSSGCSSSAQAPARAQASVSVSVSKETCYACC